MVGRSSTVAPTATRCADTDMDPIISLVLLLASAQSHGEPLREAVQRRSDVIGVYASEFIRGYEPMAFAAVPLHAPLPIIHIVSTAPLPMTRYPPTQQSQRQRQSSPYNLTPSYSHHVSSYVQAPTSLATSYSHQTHYPTYAQQVGTYGQQPNTYRQQPMAFIPHQETYDHHPIYRQPNVYASSIPQPINTEPPEIEDDGLTILYARPQPQGGYTYHRKPSKRRAPPKRREPVIIRVHKYRVVKGR